MSRMDCPHCGSTAEPINIIDSNYIECRECARTTEESEWQ